MSNGAEKTGPEKWHPSNRLNGNSAIDPALFGGLRAVPVPLGFREAANHDISFNEISKAVVRFHNVCGATPVRDFLSKLEADKQQKSKAEFDKFLSGMQADLAVILNNAGVQNPDIIIIEESCSLVRGIRGTRYLVQAYLQDGKDQYLAINQHRKVESSSYPISVHFIGREINEEIYLHPFPIFSKVAFAEASNRQSLGPVLLGELSDGVSSFVSAAQKDPQLPSEDSYDFIPSKLASGVVREGSGVFRVKINESDYRFRLSLTDNLLLQCQFVERL